MHNPSHPGSAIREAVEFLQLTPEAFAAKIGVDADYFTDVLEERAAVTTDLSLRVSKEFGQGQSDIWFRVQQAHDEWVRNPEA